jgi:putative intracellular protease/amidase
MVLNRRHLLLAVGGALVLAALGFAGWLLALPAAPPATAAPAPVPQAETQALLAALAPPKRQRPIVAVVGLNDATETTDYLMPYGILKRSGVADVMALATDAGPVRLYPALTVQPDTTTSAFDSRHPEGADYVVVPAMSRDDDPSVLAWLQAQARKGATIIGVCAGAKVVAAAGLLDGKRATTHWYYRDELLDSHPTITYVKDRRIVVDGAVVTTTGISASMPMALTLIEAIAGRARADAVARELGLGQWDAAHDSDAFVFNRRFAMTAMGNAMARWNHETVVVPLEAGIDEVALALTADAWSRTYRSNAVTRAASAVPVRSRGGLQLVPDRVAAGEAGDGVRLPAQRELAPMQALDEALRGIAARYGERTAELVAMQLELPRAPPSR